MQFPDNLKYSKDHEWVRVEGDEAYVGITEFAAGELGDIVFVDVDTEGESLDKDEVSRNVCGQPRSALAPAASACAGD